MSSNPSDSSIKPIFNQAARGITPSIAPPRPAPKLELHMPGIDGNSVRQAAFSENMNRAVEASRVNMPKPEQTAAKTLSQKFYKAAGITPLSPENKAGRQAQELGKLKEKFNSLSLSR